MADQYFQYYGHTHCCVKWWKRVFYHLLEVCLVNAFIVHNSVTDNTALSSLKFCQAVIEGLLQGWQRDQSRRGQRSSRPDLPARITERGHVPSKTENERKPDCVVCSDRAQPGGRKQTSIMCNKCDKAVCCTLF